MPILKQMETINSHYAVENFKKLKKKKKKKKKKTEQKKNGIYCTSPPFNFPHFGVK